MTAPIADCSNPISNRSSAARVHAVGLDLLGVVHHRAGDPDTVPSSAISGTARARTVRTLRVGTDDAELEVDRESTLEGARPMPRPPSRHRPDAPSRGTTHDVGAVSGSSPMIRQYSSDQVSTRRVDVEFEAAELCRSLCLGQPPPARLEGTLGRESFR